MNTETPLPRRDAIAMLSALPLLGAAAAYGQSTGPSDARVAGAGRSLGGLTAAELGYDATTRQFTLPPLPYPAGALEPHLDAETMTIHHDNHHASYVKGMNTALAKLAEIREGRGEADLAKHWHRELAFHGSGHFNHTLLWNTLAPANRGGGQAPAAGSALAELIARDFGSFDAMLTQFKAASVSVEGSGWGWLVYSPSLDALAILQGEKQQNMATGDLVPILGCDVWEHAYYLKYRSKRADYVNAFTRVINWERVGAIMSAARGR